jgi:hypothetical protein
VSFSLSSAASFFDWSQFRCFSLRVRLVLCTPHVVLRERRNEVPENSWTVRDKQGKPYSVRYEAVNAMLLDEFLKEHRKNEQREAIIAQLKRDFQSRLQQKQIEALTAGLQKVSTQIEARQTAPQMVNNP